VLEVMALHRQLQVFDELDADGASKLLAVLPPDTRDGR